MPSRLWEHLRNSAFNEEMTRIEIRRLPTEKEMLNVEASLISEFKPKHNVIGNRRRDRGYQPRDLFLVDNLKAFIEANEITQNDVAFGSGLSKLTISTWIRGTRSPRVGGDIKRLADYMGTTIDNLCFERLEFSRE